MVDSIHVLPKQELEFSQIVNRGKIKHMGLNICWKIDLIWPKRRSLNIREIELLKKNIFFLIKISALKDILKEKEKKEMFI